jgi:hypothetical protein
VSGDAEITDAAMGPGPGPLARLAVPLGIAVGCLVYFALSRVISTPVEVWNGADTFTDPMWFAAVAVTPAVSGFVTGLICGHNGKWFGMFPVTLIHSAEYYLLLKDPNPEAQVLGVGLFVFFMIVMLELALMAAWGAEILRQRLAGRDVRA